LRGPGRGVCVPFFFAVSWGAMPQKKWLESARIRAVVSADYECGTNGVNFMQSFWGRETLRKDNGRK
jgi:hypothetical protein